MNLASINLPNDGDNYRGRDASLLLWVERWVNSGWGKQDDEEITIHLYLFSLVAGWPHGIGF